MSKLATSIAKPQAEIPSKESGVGRSAAEIISEVTNEFKQIQKSLSAQSPSTRAYLSGRFRAN
ncbi:hypothetical protein ACFFUT_17300 [Pseudohalocynthiibacter aestuariivivens]|uniref:Uncharacterized protein n=1 Tax=Pseudohalocynthiibacter aestuariivivens TaxID=1591409 RepID=A0ABV5JJD2_9RHOB|nr:MULTISPECIES: hypothetical protein [Pseudohalocynthiibacter]MBS9718321.1 hypothetical protein [Pseudohalocynthiibacter aestuariivivens]MCK0103544.1 hypothetical protein [Pseudohalocynthiibacter sp. F2068]